VQLFDTNATTYQELCNTRTSDIDLTIAEGRLTWLVYIIGRLAYLYFLYRMWVRILPVKWERIPDLAFEILDWVH
jgi:hypothetical protein